MTDTVASIRPDAIFVKCAFQEILLRCRNVDSLPPFYTFLDGESSSFFKHKIYIISYSYPTVQWYPELLNLTCSNAG